MIPFAANEHSSRDSQSLSMGQTTRWRYR